MVTTISPDMLDEAVRKELESYSVNIVKAIDSNLKEVAEKTAGTLKKGGPYKERTGKYTPDWTVTERPGRSVVATGDYSVNNRRHYQLTHLLEKGHVTRSGSRTKKYEHILPAEQAAQELAIEAVEKAVRTVNGTM